MRLPGFKRGPFDKPSQYGELKGVGGPSASLVAVFWSLVQGEEMLVLEVSCGKWIVDSQPIAIILNTSAGIYSPRDGVRLDAEKHGITVATDAGYGPTSHVPVEKVTPIGFLRLTQLTFSSNKANTPTSLRISFTPSMQISPDDVLKLELPGFSSPAVKSFTVFGYCPVGRSECGDALGIWNRTTFTLTITFLSGLSPESPIYLVVPEEKEGGPGLYIPVSGVREDDPNLKISISAGAGKCDAIPIEESDPIGAFEETSISFIPQVAGSVCSITIKFVPLMPIQDMYSVGFNLPNFDTGNPTILTVEHDKISTVSWNPLTSMLTAYVTKKIFANELVELTIPSSHGIRVPLTGIRSVPLLGQAFLIRTDAIEGEVPWTDVQKFPAIGSFRNTTRMTFDPARGGSQSRITISFAPEMRLFPDDTINISLPKFSGPDFDLLNTSSIYLPSSSEICVLSNILGVIRRVVFTGPRTFETILQMTKTQNVTELRNVTTVENVTTEVICPSNKTHGYDVIALKNVTRERNVSLVRYRNNYGEVTLPNGLIRTTNHTCEYVEFEMQNTTEEENVTETREMHRTFFVTRLQNVTREINMTFERNFTHNTTRVVHDDVARLQLQFNMDVQRRQEIVVQLLPCTGIVLPSLGLRSVEPDVTIETQVIGGPVQKTPFFFYPTLFFIYYNSVDFL